MTYIYITFEPYSDHAEDVAKLQSPVFYAGRLNVQYPGGRKLPVGRARCFDEGRQHCGPPSGKSTASKTVIHLSLSESGSSRREGPP